MNKYKSCSLWQNSREIVAIWEKRERSNDIAHGTKRKNELVARIRFEARAIVLLVHKTTFERSSRQQNNISAGGQIFNPLKS